MIVGAAEVIDDGGGGDGDTSGRVIIFAAALVDVVFLIVFGIPHIFDSVSLTTLSLGLLGLHIAAICYGVNVGIP